MLLLFVCHDTGGCTMSMIQVSLGLCICYSYPTAQTSSKIVIAALHDNMPWLTLSWSHAFAGDPEDAISRKRILYLEHERYFVTDAGGKHTYQTPDVFNNQQIMQTSGRPLKVINIGRLSADAGQPETASQPSCAAETADQAKHSASAQREKVTCSASEVANQLQQDNCFAFSTHCHDPILSAAGMLSLPYYCSRGPKPPQTFIRQYLLLGDLPQRRSTATCKQAGCQCHVRLIYPEGSYQGMGC